MWYCEVWLVLHVLTKWVEWLVLRCTGSPSFHSESSVCNVVAHRSLCHAYVGVSYLTRKLFDRGVIGSCFQKDHTLKQIAGYHICLYICACTCQLCVRLVRANKRSRW